MSSRKCAPSLPSPLRAEAATPYGIESFDSVLKPLWKGIRMHRGKGLAAFLKVNIPTLSTLRAVLCIVIEFKFSPYLPHPPPLLCFKLFLVTCQSLAFPLYITYDFYN